MRRAELLRISIEEEVEMFLFQRGMGGAHSHIEVGGLGEREWLSDTAVYVCVNILLRVVVPNV